MDVTGVTSPTSAKTNDTTTSMTSGATVDYNQFLQLLIAQMRNQDPMNPTDSSQYMSQLAQLSSVEQAVQTNTKLDSLLANSALSQADGLIGHTATFTDASGQTSSGKITEVYIVQGGAVATLEGGVKVQLGPGITIS
jgi:flagellar basal-body rod modification protein FlgD